MLSTAACELSSAGGILVGLLPPNCEHKTLCLGFFHYIDLLQGCTCAMKHTWRSEDNVCEFLLSTLWVPGMELGLGNKHLCL